MKLLRLRNGRPFCSAKLFAHSLKLRTQSIFGLWPFLSIQGLVSMHVLRISHDSQSAACIGRIFRHDSVFSSAYMLKKGSDLSPGCGCAEISDCRYAFPKLM